MSLLLVQLLSGLANAMFLFLIASGLSLIFGVTRIVNFAHGSFYMLAAYLTYSLAAVLPGGPAAFYLAALLAALGVAAIGGLVEVLLPRRAGAGRVGADRGPALPLLRPGDHPVRAAGGPRPLAALPPHPLGRADPGGHPGPRDGGRARRRPVAALHFRLRARLVPGRARRRAPGTAARPHHRDGHLGDRGGLRGGGDRGHGLGVGRAAGLAADRGAQRLRRAAAAEGGHRAHLRGDGGGAGGAAVGPPRPPR